MVVGRVALLLLRCMVITRGGRALPEVQGNQFGFVRFSVGFKMKASSGGPLIYKSLCAFITADSSGLMIVTSA